METSTKSQQAGCCLFLLPPLWPLLIIVSPILWLLHAVEKRTIAKRAKRDYEKNLENLKKIAKEEKKSVKYKKRNPYHPFGTREEYLAHKKEEEEEYLSQKEEELRKKEKIKYLAEAYKQRNQKKDFKRNLKKADDLGTLSPVEFEKWVKAEIFESNGWKVEETKVTGDGGVDLIVTKKDERSIAQCKRFKGTVGEPMIRDFYGAMMHEGVSRGFFITTGLYSLPALKFAEDKPIEMIDRRVLASKYL